MNTTIEELLIASGGKAIEFRCKFYKSEDDDCPCNLEGETKTCKEFCNQEVHAYKVTKEQLEAFAQALLSQGEPVELCNVNSLYSGVCSKGTKYCTKIHVHIPSNEPSKGEPVKPYGYVYVSYGNFLFKQELTENERFVYSSLPVYKHLLSTEALQKDKADLIEYAKKQHKALGQMLAIHDSTDAMAHDGATTRVLARKVLATQQPKCMQGE